MQSNTIIDSYRLHIIVNVYKINTDIFFRPSFETYRRRVDLLLCGSNFRQIHTKMKLKLVTFGFLTHVPLLFSFIMSSDSWKTEESLSNIRRKKEYFCCLNVKTESEA
jgi:hypothetical protein